MMKRVLSPDFTESKGVRDDSEGQAHRCARRHVWWIAAAVSAYNAVVAWLLARMLRKTLFVALNRMVAPASEIALFVAGHKISSTLRMSGCDTKRADNAYG